MHELSLCEGVLQVLEESAAREQFNHVRAVWLEVGVLAGVEVEAMRFGFDLVTRGSIAEGARLEIIERPGRAWCLACSAPITVSARFDPCPECGSHQIQITDGEELRIKELEVE